MTNKKKKWAGATRSQLALIGVLSLVLVGVIVAQLPDSLPKPERRARAQARPTVPSALPEETKSDPKPQKEKPKPDWPAFSPSEVARRDPFAMPAWYRDIQSLSVQENETVTEPEVEQKLVLKELQETGAAIVLIADSMRIAEVGDQQVRVGDKIDGYEVSDITPSGVILTKSKSR